MSTATEDDLFNGYRIPAGSTVLANHWGMCFRLLIFNPSKFRLSLTFHMISAKKRTGRSTIRNCSNRVDGSSDQKALAILTKVTRRSGFPGGEFIVPFIRCDMNSTIGCIRICPGKLLAVNSLFVVLSHLCYAFDIKAKEGVVVDTQAYTTRLNVRACKATLGSNSDFITVD